MVRVREGACGEGGRVVVILWGAVSLPFLENQDDFNISLVKTVLTNVPLHEHL